MADKIEQMNAEERARKLEKTMEEIYSRISPGDRYDIGQPLKAIENALTAHGESERAKALRDGIITIEQVNVHGFSPYQNGIRNGFKIAIEMLEVLMEADGS